VIFLFLAVMETASRSVASDPRAPAVGSSKRKGVGGSGSSEDSMASELGRLSEENAHYRRKISDLMGKAPAVPTHARTSSGPLFSGGGSTERVSDPCSSHVASHSFLACSQVRRRSVPWVWFGQPDLGQQLEVRSRCLHVHGYH
jgi:hypothetical protein